MENTQKKNTDTENQKQAVPKEVEAPKLTITMESIKPDFNNYKAVENITLGHDSDKQKD